MRVGCRWGTWSIRVVNDELVWSVGKASPVAPSSWWSLWSGLVGSLFLLYPLRALTAPHHPVNHSAHLSILDEWERTVFLDWHPTQLENLGTHMLSLPPWVNNRLRRSFLALSFATLARGVTWVVKWNCSSFFFNVSTHGFSFCPNGLLEFPCWTPGLLQGHCHLWVIV